MNSEVKTREGSNQMKNELTKKTSVPARSTEHRGLRPRNKTRPHGLLSASDEQRSEALKHWLQIESELMNASRGLRWVTTFTP